MDILATANNRKLIETFLHEVSGKDWTLEIDRAGKSSRKRRTVEAKRV